MMSGILEWTAWVAGVLAIPVPIAAIVMCTSLKPHSVFRKLGESQLLRHWSMVLVVACSAVAGAWVWAGFYAKYHALEMLQTQEGRRSQAEHAKQPPR